TRRQLEGVSTSGSRCPGSATETVALLQPRLRERQIGRRAAGTRQYRARKPLAINGDLALGGHLDDEVHEEAVVRVHAAELARRDLAPGGDDLVILGDARLATLRQRIATGLEGCLDDLVGRRGEVRNQFRHSLVSDVVGQLLVVREDEAQIVRTRTIARRHVTNMADAYGTPGHGPVVEVSGDRAIFFVAQLQARIFPGDVDDSLVRQPLRLEIHLRHTRTALRRSLLGWALRARILRLHSHTDGERTRHSNPGHTIPLHTRSSAEVTDRLIVA